MATKVAIAQREQAALARIQRALNIDTLPTVRGDYQLAVQLEAIADAAEKAQRTERSFEEMTIEQLRKYAADNSIDLEGASRKADIIALIEAANG